MNEPVNIADYEVLAAAALGRSVGHYAGGAGDERTLADNVAAGGRHKLLPRALVDVSCVDTATTVLGTPISLPVLVAPVALEKMAHPDGECAMARAAAAGGRSWCSRRSRPRGRVRWPRARPTPRAGFRSKRSRTA